MGGPASRHPATNRRGKILLKKIKSHSSTGQVAFKKIDYSMLLFALKKHIVSKHDTYSGSMQCESNVKDSWGQ